LKEGPAPEPPSPRTTMTWRVTTKHETPVQNWSGRWAAVGRGCRSLQATRSRRTFAPDTPFPPLSPGLLPRSISRDFHANSHGLVATTKDETCFPASRQRISHGNFNCLAAPVGRRSRQGAGHGSTFPHRTGKAFQELVHDAVREFVQQAFGEIFQESFRHLFRGILSRRPGRLALSAALKARIRCLR
jgi:hypothetical protein